MKEVTRKDLPEVSGGEFPPDGCIPYPNIPGTDGETQPRGIINPLVDSTGAPEA